MNRSSYIAHIVYMTGLGVLAVIWFGAAIAADVKQAGWTSAAVSGLFTVVGFLPVWAMFRAVSGKNEDARREARRIVDEETEAMVNAQALYHRHGRQTPLCRSRSKAAVDGDAVIDTTYYERHGSDV